MASREIFKYVNSDKTFVEVILARESGKIYSVKLPLLEQSELKSSKEEYKNNFPGVIPHIWKCQSLEDYRNNKDTVLEFVKKKIKHKRE